VLYAHLPARDLSFPRADDVGNSDVFSKDFAAPAIVVSRHPQDVDARVLELSERRERTKASSRDYRFPLEPEIEQIAIDDERSCLVRQSAQKRDERALDLLAGDSEVRVGYDIAGALEHVTS
jgi:hypothetical protein